MPLASVSNSNQAPRLGMVVCPKLSRPFLSALRWKYEPGLRTNWLTIKRSEPLLINVPISVMSGKSPKKTSCVFNSPVSLFTRRKVT